MAPPRPLKRQKTNPTEEQLPDSAQAAQPPQTAANHQQTVQAQETPPAVSASPINSTGQSDPSSQSWYSRTWPRKAAPVTQVARESISSASSAASELASVVKDKVTERRGSTRTPSLAMTLGKTKSNRSLPVNATTTVVHATSDPTSPKRRKSSASRPNPEVKQINAKQETAPAQVGSIPTTSEPQKADTDKSNTPQPSEETAPAKPVQVQSPGWFGWRAQASDPPVAIAANTAGSGLESVPKDSLIPTKPDTKVPHAQQLPVIPPDTAEQPSNKRSWLQMWGGSTPSRPTTPTAAEPNRDSMEQSPKPTQNVNIKNVKAAELKPSSSEASSLQTAPPPPLPGDGTKSSAWVFWSREKAGTQTPTSGEQPHIGELAISDSPSQGRPRRASISLAEQDKPVITKPNKQVEAIKNTSSPKPEVIKSIEPATPADVKVEKKGHVKQDSKTVKAESSNAAAVVHEPAEASTSRTASPTPSKKTVENLLLPSLTEVLHHPDSPSILQQLARLLYYTNEPELKHLHLVKDPPRIKNALAIGVHGYFPAPLIRTVFGQPTGTSIKFAELAAKSIRKWTRVRGYDCQVKTAALEGEGKIAERIELLWRLLLNWLDEIRKSDFVMVACHSQGVPVAIMLVAKLIHFGCVSAARIGICAMAGVNMGPFPKFKSRWISGSAGELFEFSNPESRVSQDFQSALDTVLRFGVRLTFIGSIDDQLVSLESSIFAPVTHPHIYRAVFVDARVHAPNFISHLVGFVLKLRNLGIQDHGLIRELSSPLAGSLYSGEGHSRIYEDDAVYDLAVAFALETNSLPEVAVHKRATIAGPQSAAAGNNPYILPFAMRGILEEDFVKTDLQDEAAELLRQFDEWKPSTKVLKDVKFRLEGIRSKI